jgi:hypothetical protein
MLGTQPRALGQHPLDLLNDHPAGQGALQLLNEHPLLAHGPLLQQ